MGKVKGSGKRRKLIITEKSRSSDEETKPDPKKGEKPCKHINKAIRSQTVENVLRHLRKGECKDCRGKPKLLADLSIEEELDLALSVCICLKCGYQGCSRNAEKQHAHTHFLKESQHSVCINTTTWMIWCYACDKELSNNGDNSQLQKTVKLIYDEMSKKASDEDSEPTTYVSGNVKGLRNLGNTCFFNSVMQNISQTGVLVKRLDDLFAMEEEVMVESEKLPKIELKVKKTSAIGPLTSTLKCFLDDFHNSTRETVAPSKLFGEITKKSPQFRGYRQQDSQELLRYLLDGMRVEELKRIEAGMKDAVKSLEYPPSKEQLRECINNAKTFVDDVFGGSLVSTIICTQCKTKSQVHDNFLDLSLPVSTAPRESAKSAASKLLGSTQKKENKSVSEDERPKERKLSKHQVKAKLRKEKKAKRSKGKTGHGQKGSKEGSISGDADDTKYNRDEEKDGDDDGGRDESFDSSKFSKEDGDVKSARNMPENGSNTLIANFDSVEQYSFKDEAEFVIVDRISGPDSGNDPNFIPKQAILGGGTLRPQSSNKSSLESLVSGESSSLASARCVSSREDVSFDELSPQRENHLHAGRKGAGYDGISHTETYHDPSVQSDNKGLVLETVEKEEDVNTIKDIATAFDSSLKLNDKVNDGGERRISSENGKEAVLETKEGEKLSFTEECRLNDKGGNEEDMVVEMKERLEDHLLENAEAKSNEDVIKEMKGDGTGVISEERNGVVIQKDLQNIKKEDLLTEKTTNASEEKGIKITEEIRQRNTEEDTQKLQGNAMPIVEIGVDLETRIDDRQEGPMSGTDEVKMEDIRVDAEERTEGLAQELRGKTDELAEENNDDDIDNEHEDSCDEDSTDDDSEQENDDVETVSPEYICKSGECSILSCLHQFTSKDVLEGNNKFRCDECTKRRKISSGDEKIKPVFTEATKQMLLWKAPPVLTLHLKRFEQVGRSLRKLNKHIEFPLELDLTPFCFKNSMVSFDNLQYSLHGIVEHSGSLHGGHYVAYVKTRTIDNKTKWYYISDSRVSEIQEEAVLRKQAYILFYHQNEQ